MLINKILRIITILAGGILTVNIASAELLNRGADSLGNRLIYDSDLDITWYDYTNDINSQYYHANWARNLTVNFGGNVYDDWRLPIAFDQSCQGWNCTNSELGDLYYNELGNTSGAGGFTNMVYFQHLQALKYWTETVTIFDSWLVYDFDFSKGYQGTDFIDGPGSPVPEEYEGAYAIAVRAGDITIVPEPISSILFFTGGTLFAGRSYIKRKKTA